MSKRLHEVVNIPMVDPLHAGHLVIRSLARVLLLQRAPDVRGIKHKCAATQHGDRRSPPVDAKASTDRGKELVDFYRISRFLPGLPLCGPFRGLLPVCASTWDVKLVAVVGQLNGQHGVALLHETAGMCWGSICISQPSRIVGEVSFQRAMNCLEAQHPERYAQQCHDRALVAGGEGWSQGKTARGIPHSALEPCRVRW